MCTIPEAEMLTILLMNNIMSYSYKLETECQRLCTS